MLAFVQLVLLAVLVVFALEGLAVSSFLASLQEIVDQEPQLVLTTFQAGVVNEELVVTFENTIVSAAEEAEQTDVVVGSSSVVE